MFLRKNVFFIFICLLIIGDWAMNPSVYVENSSIKSHVTPYHCNYQYTQECKAVEHIEYNDLDQNRWLQPLEKYTRKTFQKELRQTDQHGSYNNPRRGYSLNFDENKAN